MHAASADYYGIYMLHGIYMAVSVLRLVES